MISHFHFLVDPTQIWTPAAISTALWLDAADADTITASSGSVSVWADKSGNESNATQGTAANQPLTGTTSIGEKNTLAFDGASYMSATGALSDLLASSETIVAMVALENTPAASYIYTYFSVSDTTRASSEWCIRSTDVSSYYYHVLCREVNFGQFLPTSPIHYGGADVFDTPMLSTHTASAIADANGHKSIIYRSGSKTSGNIAHVTMNTVDNQNAVTIGANRDSGGPYEWGLDGQLGEIVAVVGDSSEATRQKLEGYLAWKWGLQTNLPTGHPYRYASPTI